MCIVTALSLLFCFIVICVLHSKFYFSCLHLIRCFGRCTEQHEAEIEEPSDSTDLGIVVSDLLSKAGNLISDKYDNDSLRMILNSCQTVYDLLQEFESSVQRAFEFINREC